MSEISKRESHMYPVKNRRQTMLIDNVLFIDPGLGGTGWAFFERIDTYAGKGKQKTKGFLYESPANSGVYFGKGAALGKTREICAWFDGLCGSLDPALVVIEWPEFWVSSAKSHAATAQGDLFKLVYLIGGMGEVIRKRGIGNPILVTPRKWKGQLSKGIVVKRIASRMGYINMEDHEEDAVGMGLAAQGGML